jgi:hypothetical protein
MPKVKIERKTQTQLRKEALEAIREARHRCLVQAVERGEALGDAADERLQRIIDGKEELMPGQGGPLIAALQLALRRAGRLVDKQESKVDATVAGAVLLPLREVVKPEGGG